MLQLIGKWINIIKITYQVLPPRCNTHLFTDVAGVNLNSLTTKVKIAQSHIS